MNFKRRFIVYEKQISRVEYLNSGCDVSFEKTEKGIYIDEISATDEKFHIFKLYKNND